MATTPIIHTSFSVTSGHLCFGDLENIWHGASTEPVHGFPTFSPLQGGTVMQFDFKYNVPAENGTWNAIQLVDVASQNVRGWLVTHEDVDPAPEIDKILRVSGSPYERDSGSSMNNEDTKAEGVLVINRYDWGYYTHDRIQVDGIETFDDYDPYMSESVGLVDCQHAKDQVTQWKDQHPCKRGSSVGALWLRIPDGEYKFGRFGYNDTRTAARSFLFFTTNTEFCRTALSGFSQSLRRNEDVQ
ncbi:hypothetical protein B0J13DRAFT_564576 [Dactylonectria estremocensis]|uniref:Uncharacterized protein n=1 Tax=Dactylonectria estremocensis TaxID=1079267 RepID=A0A9P9IQT3_9HYPO|nr:hypothetical protein B0J13DRAFT_564576 [Dactylonectria estremocensis]